MFVKYLNDTRHTESPIWHEAALALLMIVMMMTMKMELSTQALSKGIKIHQPEIEPLCSRVQTETKVTTSLLCDFVLFASVCVIKNLCHPNLAWVSPVDYFR